MSIDMNLSENFCEIMRLLARSNHCWIDRIQSNGWIGHIFQLLQRTKFFIVFSPNRALIFCEKTYTTIRIVRKRFSLKKCTMVVFSVLLYPMCPMKLDGINYFFQFFFVVNKIRFIKKKCASKLLTYLNLSVDSIFFVFYSCLSESNLNICEFTVISCKDLLFFIKRKQWKQSWSPAKKKCLSWYRYIESLKMVNIFSDLIFLK